MTTISVNAAAFSHLVATLANLTLAADTIERQSPNTNQLALDLEGSAQANEVFMAEREELKNDLEIAELRKRAAEDERDVAIVGREQITEQLVKTALYLSSLQRQLGNIGITWTPSEVVANAPQVSIDADVLFGALAVAQGA